MASSSFPLPSPEAHPSPAWTGVMDESSNSRLGRFDSFDKGEAHEIELRKQVIDQAFSKLLNKFRNVKNGPSKPLFNDRDEDMSYGGGDLNDEDDDNYNLRRSSDEESNNTEDLDDFSGLEDLGLSEDDELINEGVLTEHVKRKPRQPREYPGSRKQRGFHKWAGRIVALLSTGEVGYVLKKPGGRITIRLYDSGVEVSASEEKLRVLESTGPDCVEEIYQYARFVPQLKDLKIGQRVAMVRYDNATGRVVRLPDEKRAMMGLGHVVVQMDNSDEQRKAVVESLRIVDESHPVISLPTQTTKIVGRPTKAVVANKAPPPQIQAVLPYSKRGEAWKDSLKPPGLLPPPSPAPRGAHQYDSEGGSVSNGRKEAVPFEDRPAQKRVKALMNADKPALTRGRKLCHACQAVIGTACKTCTQCGAPCRRRDPAADMVFAGNGGFKASSSSSGGLF